MGIDRRGMMGGSAAALAAALLPREAFAGEAIPPAPKAKLTPATDVYFGESVVDPYRWMENDKDPDWLPYLKAQNDRTRGVLDALPGRDKLMKRVQALSGDLAATRKVQRAGDKLFYEQRPVGADNFKLFVREGGRDRVLVDPTALSTGGAGHLSLDWWNASFDGVHVAYGLSKDGSEDSTLHVLKTCRTGRTCLRPFLQTQQARPQWLPDGSGFFYNQLVHPVGAPERFLDSLAKLHRLGTEPASDPVLMKIGHDPAISL